MKRIVIIILSVIMLIFAGIGVYVFIMLESIPRSYVGVIDKKDSSTIAPEEAKRDQNIGEPLGGNGNDLEGIYQNNQDITGSDDRDIVEIKNILLLGIDRYSENEAGRSDAIMIATMDRMHGKLKLTSLMRDMYLPIPEHSNNRLNAAFAFGGASLAIQTINENFDMNLEHYVIIDFVAFEKIVDKLGGISIDISAAELNAIPESLGIKGYGVQNLSGRQALEYSRIRSVGRDDFGRVDRQQIVLTKLFEKISETSIFRLPGMLSSIHQYIRTNLSSLEILSLGSIVLGFDDKTIHRFRLPADDTFRPDRVRGMQVLIPDIEKNTELLHEFIYENR